MATSDGLLATFLFSGLHGLSACELELHSVRAGTGAPGAAQSSWQSSAINAPGVGQS